MKGTGSKPQKHIYRVDRFEDLLCSSHFGYCILTMEFLTEVRCPKASSTSRGLEEA